MSDPVVIALVGAAASVLNSGITAAAVVVVRRNRRDLRRVHADVAEVKATVDGVKDRIAAADRRELSGWTDGVAS